MFSHRLDFSRRFQKNIPKMANLAFVRKANYDSIYLGLVPTWPFMAMFHLNVLYGFTYRSCIFFKIINEPVPRFQTPCCGFESTHLGAFFSRFSDFVAHFSFMIISLGYRRRVRKPNGDIAG